MFLTCFALLLVFFSAVEFIILSIMILHFIFRNNDGNKFILRHLSTWLEGSCANCTSLKEHLSKKRFNFGDADLMKRNPST